MSLNLILQLKGKGGGVLLPQTFLYAYILDMEQDKHTMHIIKKGRDPVMEWPGSREKHIRIMLVPTVNF